MLFDITLRILTPSKNGYFEHTPAIQVHENLSLGILRANSPFVRVVLPWCALTDFFCRQEKEVPWIPKNESNDQVDPLACFLRGIWWIIQLRSFKKARDEISLVGHI